MNGDTIEINDGQFYLAQINGTDTVHNTRDGAINHLKEGASGVDPETSDISIVEVTFNGDDWQIKELPWQQIALRLLGGGE
jgi:hypothetical protein